MRRMVRSDWKNNKMLYLMILPVIVFYLIFSYKPMYGAVIAFKDYSPGAGFAGSPWVGLKHFQDFFASPDFWRLITNTLRISFTSLVFGFPAPIILALLMNEIRNRPFQRISQTITYLPHFISIVVVCGMIKNFVAEDGVISYFAAAITGQTPQNMLQNENLFLPVYIISNIWQGMGWDSIIYLSALTAIDTQLYEAAQMDGAGKWKQVLHVTIPGIAPTIIIMLILRMGNILQVGHEKIILLYNSLIYSKADVISTYVYRLGFEGQQWSYTTAIGLFNSVVNFGFLFCANALSKKFSETSLW